MRAVLTETRGLVQLLAAADRTDRATRHRGLGLSVKYEKEDPTGRKLVRAQLELCPSPKLGRTIKQWFDKFVNFHLAKVTNGPDCAESWSGPVLTNWRIPVSAIKVPVPTVPTV